MMGARFIREIPRDTIIETSKSHLGVTIQAQKLLGSKGEESNTFIPLRRHIIGESEICKFKRLYRQTKYNPWLTYVISQVKPVSSQHYRHYYLMIYKTASQERMQWLHHSLRLGMGMQQIQELARIMVKTHLLKKQ